MHVATLFLGELGTVSLFDMFSNNWFQDARFLRWLIYLFLWQLLHDTHFP